MKIIVNSRSEGSNDDKFLKTLNTHFNRNIAIFVVIYIITHEITARPNTAVWRHLLIDTVRIREGNCLNEGVGISLAYSQKRLVG